MVNSKSTNIIRPQEGYQEKALSSSADIVVGGGAAGVGKTFALLLECLRNIRVPNFGATIFRLTTPMIKTQGGLWDSSVKMFSDYQGANPTESSLKWSFPAFDEKEDRIVKNTIKFKHLESEKDLKNYQGAEIPLICFDELTHFSEKMFFYMLSRNRSTCGVAPYIRATCNPDPDSWVRTFIDWFIGDDGFPIPERQGVLRYFMRHDNKYIWGSSKAEVIEKAGSLLTDLIEEGRAKGIELDVNDFVKSMTFIGGSIYDNKKLLSSDPGYLGNLNAQGQEEKMRLFKGNWNVKISKNDIYDFISFRDIFTNTFVEKSSIFAKKVITTDIALKGSDMFVVFVWQGKMLIDFKVMKKSYGKEVVTEILKLAHKHKVRNSNIIFDNDGVGGFIDGENGFIPNSVEFKNGGKVVNNENYKNLKSQCFFKSGKAVKVGEYYIPPSVANRPYDEKMTLQERLMHERRAIKQDKPEKDGKLCVTDKSEMKIILNGDSPDLMDAFMMREYEDIRPQEVEVYIY